ncbi:hypothetical protein [Streptomyces sp. NPDC097619]|uniref:hypothetical protein n=1 Tax=Streptomyces sp. NPDC097619 TaxID=3157228 RepID=UPI003327D6C7
MSGGGRPAERLRPGVAVTPLRAGLHLRGRGAGVTLEGSAALPRLWELLAPRLGAAPAPAEGGAPPAPAVAAALDALAERLREQDLLVPADEGAGAAPWPAAAAGDPVAATARLGAARPVVSAAAPTGPLAAALLRALAAADAVPEARTGPGLPPGLALVTAAGPTGPVAVAVGRTADGGFVSAPGAPRAVRATARALADRLRVPGPGRSAGGSGTAVGTELLAGAAAHRLLCAVAGLPDPAAHEEDLRFGLPGVAAVLLTEDRPPRAAHHPWAPGGPDAGPAPGEPGGLAEALRRVSVLTDARLGALPEAAAGALPQLPAALVACPVPSGILLAGAARTDLARLEAACRSAELHLAAGPGARTGLVVGAGAGHARGRALRRAARYGPEAGAALPEEVWREHPQARHWWRVLTRRQGRRAEVTVRPLGDGAAFLAVVRAEPVAPATGPLRVVARAVEATAADAVAFAALAAVTRTMAARSGRVGFRHTGTGGAAAPLVAAGAGPAGRRDEGWTDTWLAGVADREARLLAALDGLTGHLTRPVPTGERPLERALAASGFAVLSIGPEPAPGRRPHPDGGER